MDEMYDHKDVTRYLPEGDMLYKLIILFYGKEQGEEIINTYYKTEKHGRD